MNTVKLYLVNNLEFEIEILETTTVLDICNLLKNNIYFHDDNVCVLTSQVIAFEII